MRGTPTIRSKTATSLAVVAALALMGCESQSAGPEAGADVESIVQEQIQPLEEDITALQDQVDQLESGMGGESSEQTAGDFFADPDQFVGQQVVVSGRVSSLLGGDSSFTISGDVGSGEALLVINATGASDSPVVEQDALVQVTGTVREGFSVTDVEDEFGVELDDDLYGDYEGDNYIAASNVSEPNS